MYHHLREDILFISRTVIFYFFIAHPHSFTALGDDVSLTFISPTLFWFLVFINICLGVRYILALPLLKILEFIPRSMELYNQLE